MAQNASQTALPRQCGNAATPGLTGLLINENAFIHEEEAGVGRGGGCRTGRRHVLADSRVVHAQRVIAEPKIQKHSLKMSACLFFQPCQASAVTGVILEVHRLC